MGPPLYYSIDVLCVGAVHGIREPSIDRPCFSLDVFCTAYPSQGHSEASHTITSPTGVKSQGASRPTFFGRSLDATLFRMGFYSSFSQDSFDSHADRRGSYSFQGSLRPDDLGGPIGSSSPAGHDTEDYAQRFTADYLHQDYCFLTCCIWCYILWDSATCWWRVLL